MTILLPVMMRRANDVGAIQSMLGWFSALFSLSVVDILFIAVEFMEIIYLQVKQNNFDWQSDTFE